MRTSIRVLTCALATLASLAVPAAVLHQDLGRFDPLVVPDPSSRIGTVGETPDRVTALAGVQAGWDQFRGTYGDTWKSWVDRNTGSPLLAEGAGIRWFAPGQPIEPSQLEATARRFLAANGSLFGVRESELVWNAQGSAPTDPDHWVVLFDRVVGGIPVEGESFVLYVNRGNLVAFGASRSGAIPSVPTPVYGADTAREVLYAYMGLTPRDQVEEVESGKAVLVASPSASNAGIDHRLAWRFALRVTGEAGTWVGKVDAVTGSVIAFYDDDQYSEVKGGIYPKSNDGDCANLGCEIAGFPMPFADVTVAKKTSSASDEGFFTCGKGPKNATTTLAGTYIRIADRCGSVSDSGNCTGNLDLGASSGTDCTVPSGGGGGGDTHSARTEFYHLDKAKEKARYWLPSNTWLSQQLTANPNIASSCNAYYNGSVNFYRSGGGCRNTGEISGVVCHEYGHGLDQNDGGGYDNPSEAYADVIAILEDRVSCVGRGFFASGNCSGYGNACLSCSGIRDMDYAAHVNPTPATPANFTQSNCGGGGGPCGREVHCESYVPSEAIYDLAARDLPSAGLDGESSWQLAEKLFYKSRQGSGGNAYNCSLPSSDGCGATSWFTKMLAADDDDGNLSNGTPHAAAIFAAFARHAIACGLATDPSNQSTSSCPALAATTPTVTPAPGSVTISWTAVPGAANYLVLRNDIACGQTSNVIATVAAPATSYTDANLPATFPVYYRVQAQAANTACDGPVSSCVQSAAQ